MTDLIALIPAHNEAAHILQVVQGAARHLPVLVVDDGSSDDTAALAAQAGAHVITQRPNQGKGAALKTGFQFALDQNCAGVITLDADGQHDPAEIPFFLAAYEKRHADLIIGARDFAQMPFTRRLANTTGKILFSWAVGRSIRDNQSGYRLISRRLIEASLQARHGGFEYEVEMIVIAIQQNMPIDWVTIRTIYGDEKSHITPVQHVARFINLALETRRRMRSR
ncbi:MAG: glycosyltransferase family 2 protein [Anaerolineae bacterium]|nr:glycosyltransferase family 2 protein [Anaerolineae bacterium]